MTVLNVIYYFPFQVLLKFRLKKKIRSFNTSYTNQTYGSPLT